MKMTKKYIGYARSVFKMMKEQKKGTNYKKIGQATLYMFNNLTVKVENMEKKQTKEK